MKHLEIRFNILERKIDKIMEAMGIKPDEDEFQEIIEYTAQTLNFDRLTEYQKKKIKEVRNGNKTSQKDTENGKKI